jgi:hypothetical protein
MRWPNLVAALLILGLCSCGSRTIVGEEKSAEKKPELKAPAAVPAPAPAAEPKKELDLGGVKVNLAEKRVTVEGTVALKEGILDYLAVETAGQEYESVLALKCKGSRLHAGLLAIGAEPGPTKAVFELWKKNPPEGFKAPKAEGTKLDLTVEWTVDGKTTSVPAAKLLFNRSTKKAMDSCTWVFTGSFFAKDPEDGKEYYVADRDQDLIAVHYATSAVINVEEDAGNAYDGEDSGYQSNKDVLPASGTPIKLIITLAGKK